MEPWVGQRRRLLESLVDPVRPAGPPYSPDEVAKALRVRVRRSSLAAPLSGLTLGDREVVVNRSLAGRDYRFTLAHELGHVLVLRGAAVSAYWQSEELFADAFARELLLPAREVRACSRLRDLVKQYVLPAPEALAQIQVAGFEDPLVRDENGNIACIRCGARNRGTSCVCARRRRQVSAIPIASAVA